MIDRMLAFTQQELSQIHDASMEILADTGMRFNAKHWCHRHIDIIRPEAP